MLSSLTRTLRPSNRLSPISVFRSGDLLTTHRPSFHCQRSFRPGPPTNNPAKIENDPSNPIPIHPSAPATPNSKVVDTGDRKVQSVSPLAPIGVQAAQLHASEPSSDSPRPKIFEEFSLDGRIGIVSGGNRGLGLEMAQALCEAGAKTIYCLDLPKQPSDEWEAAHNFVEKMGNGSRLEYISADVRNQKELWDKVERVADKEGRMDVCVAAAGVLKAHQDCLEYPAEEFEEVMNINTSGVLYTAQAAGRQMVKYKRPGSIILIASMSGSITNKDHAWVSYNTSKSAVLQMARSMACELGPAGIRVNTLSPGHIYTNMTAAYLDKQPHLLDKWSSMNPLGRLGRPDELRGVVTWLASDASSFCTGSDIIVSGGHHSW